MDKFKLVTVLPIDRGVFRDELTYFSSKGVQIGDLVTIAIRNRKIDALVARVEELGSQRSQVKKLPITLKKIVEIKKQNFLNHGFLATARQISEYFVATPGQVINQFVPKVILNRNE